MQSHRAILLAITLLIFLPFQTLASPKPAYVWGEIAEGFYQTTYSFNISEEEKSTIHAFRFDPAKFKFRVLRAKDEKAGATAEQFAKAYGAILTINGGFFTPERSSIGLIANGGKKENPLHNTSWWSVFSIRNKKAYIEKPSAFSLSPDVETALQVGPRLIVDGKIPRLKESISARSAVGIAKNGDVIIAITSGLGISMGELAKRMTESVWQGGLECEEAMALDGGSSSQLYAKYKKFEFNEQGLLPVTNALAVFPR